MNAEAFPAFAQNFRTLYASILTLSTSGITSSVLFFTNLESPSIYAQTCYLFCLILFMFTMLIFIGSLFWGVKDECDEGFTTNSKKQREINQDKRRMIKLAIVPFVLAILFFVFLLTEGTLLGIFIGDILKNINMV